MWQIWLSLFLSAFSTIITLYVFLIERPEINNDIQSTINKMGGKVKVLSNSLQGQQKQINDLKETHTVLTEVKNMLVRQQQANVEQQKNNREQLRLINTLLANQKDND